MLSHARAVAASYGLSLTGRVARARSFGRAVVDEAARGGSEVVVVAAERRTRGRRAIFGEGVDFVLKHAPCRVMIAAAPVEPAVALGSARAAPGETAASRALA